ncbi:uncharacterized protein B0I36DRAFT_313323 [Microdochium trichocladiopsis]|uniref:Uncharacterized protein n=1 Tax=Microdochium trichocladiopsis TaxID=1682393 RepID=A0A9P8YAK2_9PEZI|nr:uncharacterized protein B0I36DRAFT_313323 [Microdochium trichocladiopsis]KAH7037096.1 hypothetical protein B0I36DRAFT_313323 [Microdochium trichocladiopsis]
MPTRSGPRYDPSPSPRTTHTLLSCYVLGCQHGQSGPRQHPTPRPRGSGLSSARGNKDIGAPRPARGPQIGSCSHATAC